MSVRTFLYDRFENFDKPTEDDFRVFIDSALYPTTFTPGSLEVTTSLFVDINAQAWVLDIRQCYVITYGDNVYMLFGLEGTYGLGGIEITTDNLTWIGGGTGSLEDSLTVNTSIPNAGISAGEIFPAGTTYETLFNRLLQVVEVSNLVPTSNSPTGFLEIGTNLNITQFSWTVAGVPENLHIEDSDGQYSEDVTGTQVSLNENYTYGSYKELVWTLSGDNVDPITTTAYWVEASYYGNNATGLPPTEAQILNATKVLVLTEDFITVGISTNNQDYGWVAVPAVQTVNPYSTWEVTTNSTGSIGTSSFIKQDSDVTVNGKVYNIYLYNWRSEVSSLKLY